MAKEKGTEQTAATAFVVYPGPHAQVTLQRVPEVGDLTLERGKAVELPAAVAKDLIERKKVRAAKAPKAPGETE